MRKIVVEDYDDNWPKQFDEIRQTLWEVVRDIAHSIEHIGSTAVPGLAAKPVIDVDIVVDADDVGLAISRLASIGYTHRGDLGVEGRQAFNNPSDLMVSSPVHHLYVCEFGCLALRNHLAVRDSLRASIDAVQAYSRLKKMLATKYPNDIDAYIDGKTDFLLNLMRETIGESDLDQIAKPNRKKRT